MNIVEISTVVIALATAVYTVGTFLLWKTTNRSIKLLKEEIKHQLAFNQSTATHAVLDAHRELILEIIRDKTLSETFAKALNLTEEEARTKFLATLLINHTYRVFANHKYRLAERKEMESFALDAKELFSFQFIKRRWEEVKLFHTPDFREFVEKRLTN